MTNETCSNCKYMWSTPIWSARNVEIHHCCLKSNDTKIVKLDDTCDNWESDKNYDEQRKT